MKSTRETTILTGLNQRPPRMYSQKDHFPLHVPIGFLVIVLIAGACALSVAAVGENMRFIRAANQLWEIVGMVRTTAAEQKNFATAAGENLWDGLTRVGRIPGDYPHVNPWGGEVRAVTTTNGMRLETDVPMHACRRLELYFMGYQTAEIGLISIESKTSFMKKWMTAYPLPSFRYIPDQMPEIACPGNGQSTMALVLRIR